MNVSLGPDLSVTVDGIWIGQLPDLVAAAQDKNPDNAKAAKDARDTVALVTVEHARARAGESPELVPALKSFFPDLIPAGKPTPPKPAPVKPSSAEPQAKA